MNTSIKKLSISSIESLSSETAVLNECGSTQIQSIPSLTNPYEDRASTSVPMDEYDYIKAGAKPKTSNIRQQQPTASTSTSCSSLSSLVSQTTNSSCSNQRRNNNNNKLNPLQPQQQTSSQPMSRFPQSDIILIDERTTAVQPPVEQTKCPLCLKSIGDYDLEAHFQMEHREFECPFCGLLFDSEFSMQQHLTSVHNEPTDVIPLPTSVPDSMSRFPVRDVDVFEDEAEKFDLLCSLNMI